MYRKICVPLDGSTHARGAADLALTLASALDASVTALHADESSQDGEREARLLGTLPPSLGSPPGTTRRPPGAGAPDPAAGLDAAARTARVALTSRSVPGRATDVVLADVAASGHELVVLGAVGSGADAGRSLGSTAERIVRRGRADVLVVRDGARPPAGATILTCIDGSPQSYAAMDAALNIAERLDLRVEAVAVYDPYLHYTLFNGIVGVLSEKASKVFKFKDQEKLHEEIIDTGLAKIYQAHLEVARSMAADRGVNMKIVLLDGKAHQKVLKHAAKISPWLVTVGRIGVHSDDAMDVGATTENLLRQLPCNVLVSSRKLVPPLDLRANESVQWTPEALAKMERVPPFVRGVARTAVVRWAIERGHSVITPGVINGCMGDVLPRAAAQAMGYVAEEVAKASDDLDRGRTWICSECGHASRDYRPVACPVCRSASSAFQAIDRTVLDSIGPLEKGAVEEEETFDGRRLQWTADAKDVLRRVPNGYERRRAKARVEKTAKVRGLEVVTEEFALDMVQQEMADTSYLSGRGERLTVPVAVEEMPDDAVPRPREATPLRWTDSAWKRLSRVPAGFMRDMTREKVEEFAGKGGHVDVNLALCEEGIAEGRRMMADMIGQYGRGGAAQKAVRDGAVGSRDGATGPTGGPSTT